MTKRILVVDDDRSMVATLCDILEMHGWETCGAFDGGEAAEVAAEQDVDVVLMDVRMAKVDGVEGLRRIKERRPGTRVILMTAYAARELLAEAEKQGALRILKKPVDPRQLITLLDEAASPRMPLLVVDDNPEYLRSLCDALRERGLPTIEASSLDAALSALRREPLRAVLLDLRLDHVDPDDALLAIRDVNPTVLLLLYSGYANELSKTVEGPVGRLIDAAFTKPLDVEQLMEFLDAPR